MENLKIPNDNDIMQDVMEVTANEKPVYKSLTSRRPSSGLLISLAIASAKDDASWTEESYDPYTMGSKTCEAQRLRRAVDQKSGQYDQSTIVITENANHLANCGKTSHANKEEAEAHYKQLLCDSVAHFRDPLGAYDLQEEKQGTSSDSTKAVALFEQWCVSAACEKLKDSTPVKKIPEISGSNSSSVPLTAPRCYRLPMSASQEDLAPSSDRAKLPVRASALPDESTPPANQAPSSYQAKLPVRAFALLDESTPPSNQPEFFKHSVTPWKKSTSYKTDMLAAAAAAGELEVVKKLLDEGVNSTCQSGYFGFAIQNAAFNNHGDIVKLLLQQPDKKDGLNFSRQLESFVAAIDIASSTGQNDVAYQILKVLYDRSDELPHGSFNTAIIGAAANGHLDTLRMLLKCQDQLFDEDSKWTNLVKKDAFFTACARGYPEIVKMMVDEWAIDSNTKSPEGQNALYFAAAGGHARTLAYLLDLLDQDTRYYASESGDPLYMTAKNGHEAAARLLLAAGYDVEANAGGGLDIVSLCAKNGEASMLKLLISHGLDLNKPEDRVSSALECVEGATQPGQLDIKHILEAHLANVKEEPGEKETTPKMLGHRKSWAKDIFSKRTAKETDVKAAKEDKSLKELKSLKKRFSQLFL